MSNIFYSDLCVCFFIYKNRFDLNTCFMGLFGGLKEMICKQFHPVSGTWPGKSFHILVFPPIKQGADSTSSVK